MARDPEAARVRDPLPVVENEVGCDAQPRERGEHRRRLAEREQPGDVRKTHRPPHHRLVDELEPGICQHGHGRARDRTVPLEADVYPRDVAHVGELPGANDAIAELGLQRNGRLRGQIPAMQPADLHA